VGIGPGFPEGSAGSRVDTHRLEGFSHLLEPVCGRDRVSALLFTRLSEGDSAAIETRLSGLAWLHLCRGTVGLQDLRHTPLEVFEDREQGPIRDRGAV